MRRTVPLENERDAWGDSAVNTNALKATVLVCTHNPRPHVLSRVFESLRRQTIPLADWELIVIDNNSDGPVGSWVDLAWHPQARMLCEMTPGKTSALLCGIAAARSTLLVIVDDDNLLEPTYLQEAIRIEDRYPFLGAWGGGSVGEFEGPVPEWLRPYLSFIAVKDCSEEVWTNEYFHGDATPIGAGMCIRKAVAEKYAELVAQDSGRRLLGPREEVLGRCEDTDMAITAIDVGLGVGRFPQLQLVHVIPSGRMTEPYILKLAEESQASSFVLRAIRGRPHPPLIAGSPLKQMLLWLRVWTLPRIDRRIRFALMRGYKKGQATAARLDVPSGGFEKTT
jgi:hypothetical protein